MERHIDINDFDYPLPEERIAKFPLPDRSDSKLLVYRNGAISESRFRHIDEQLPASTLIVFNNTKVIRARIIMHKASGARIEVFCLEPHDPADYERAFAARGTCSWSCIVGNLKKWKDGDVEIPFEYEGRACRLTARIAERGTREHIVRFAWDADMTFGQLLEHLGRIPIPPYLNRESEEIDLTRYQTVYSKFEGSVAAPTAGLHFTEEMLSRLDAKGIQRGWVTLHVGLGTFLPVRTKNIEDHTMHSEVYTVSQETADMINQAKKDKRPILAVGTTSVRTLESAWNKEGFMPAGSNSTSIFMYPGYKFQVVDKMFTNFHTPESTLLMLVSAFAGKEHILNAYKTAINHEYRFFSYGDAMLIG